MTNRSLLALLVTMSALAAAPAAVAEESPSTDCHTNLFAIFGGFDWQALDPDRADCGVTPPEVPTESLASLGDGNPPVMSRAVQWDPSWISEDAHPDLNRDRIKDLTQINVDVN